MLAPALVALGAFFPTALAAIQGFNYGSTLTDGSPKTQAEFQSEFNTANGLAGTSGAFTNARLYTTIQGGTANTPISAIPAAVGTNTGLLLGLWASGGQGFIDNEIAALTSAITTYGPAFAKLVTGISVGSEDLYRISPTGIAAKSGPGADPSVIADYIGQVRKAIAGTALGAVPVGHVDTWTAWVNGSNSPVIDASDFIGMDAYPYFQNTMANSIDSGSQLFFDAFDATQAAVNGKPVWVTETGWPVSGPTENLAIPSIANAKTYWDEVGCKLFGTTNTWWYTVQDAEPTTPSPSFGLVAASSTSPLYDLTCPAPGSPSSPAVAFASTSALASVASSATSAASSDANIGSPGLSPFSTIGSLAPTGTTASIASPISSGSVVVYTSAAGNGTITTVTSVVGALSGTGNTGPSSTTSTPTGSGSPISSNAATAMASFVSWIMVLIAVVAMV